MPTVEEEVLVDLWDPLMIQPLQAECRSGYIRLSGHDFCDLLEGSVEALAEVGFAAMVVLAIQQRVVDRKSLDQFHIVRALPCLSQQIGQHLLLVTLCHNTSRIYIKS
jgi:hypothetical protein